MENKRKFLNAFHLKIIGMLTMIFDHIIVCLDTAGKLYSTGLFDIKLITLFRIIGRISFIIFAFLTVEGIIKSKHKIKYILRLSIVGILMDLVSFLFLGDYFGNPITTLALGAITIYFFEHKNKYFKLFSILPITYIILIALELIPFYADYDIYGMSTFLIFYLGYISSNFFSKYIITKYNLEPETFENSSYKLTLRTTVSSILFLGFAIAIYLINPIWNNKGLFTEMNSIQIYAIFALIPIMLYNGERGYDKKWFKYGCYLFFPLHLLIIYLLILIVV